MKKSSNFLALFIAMIGISVSSNGFANPAVALSNPFYKTWNLTGEIVEGAELLPLDFMASDQLVLNEDNSIALTFMGVTSTGTFVLVNGNSWLSITLNDGTSIRFKVLSISETTLQVEHINAESVHRIFIFTAL